MVNASPASAATEDGARGTRLHGLGTALALLAAGTLLATLLALGARWWWGLELLSHFKVQYAAAQAVLLGALLVLRRPRWSAALAAGLLVNGVALLPHVPQLGVAKAAAARAAISVMTVNVQARNPRAERLIAMLSEARPDIVLLVEHTPAWQEKLAAVIADYPHRRLLPKENAFGLALLSRLPLTGSRDFMLEGAPAIEATVATPSGQFRLIGVHLRPPTRPEWLAERNRQLERLAALRAASPEPLLVLGDFNCTPFSPHFRDWLDAGGLRTTLARRGVGISWPTFLPVLGIAIDHVVVSSEFTVLEHRRLPAFGSDHYPIMARIALEGGR